MNVIVLISFPFLVGCTGCTGGCTGGSRWVRIYPLDVGWSVSSVMGWSSLGTISRSVRSIRFVVGMGAITLWFDHVCVCCSVRCVICPSNNAAMSICIFRTAATILVVLVVDVKVSSYSI